MKKESRERRSRYLKIRISPLEEERLLQLQRKTTERSLSAYVRKLVLHKPVTVKYRNVSADDFLHEMLDLKRQLQILMQDHRAAVHRLQLLEKIPEFRGWILQNQKVYSSLYQHVETILSKVAQLHEQMIRD